MDVAEIKTVPYVPLSHPFVERLLGILRCGFSDRILFWIRADLENKLLCFWKYFNGHRAHSNLDGRTADQDSNVSPPYPNIRSCRWHSHRRGLYQTPVADG